MRHVCVHAQRLYMLRDLLELNSIHVNQAQGCQGLLSVAAPNVTLLSLHSCNRVHRPAPVDPRRADPVGDDNPATERPAGLDLTDVPRRAVGPDSFSGPVIFGHNAHSSLSADPDVRYAR